MGGGKQVAAGVRVYNGSIMRRWGEIFRMKLLNSESFSNEMMLSVV